MDKKSGEAMNATMTMEVYGLAEQIVQKRIYDAAMAGESRYPECREFSISSWLGPREARARIAGSTRWKANAPGEGMLLLDMPGAFAQAVISKKPKYSSARVRLWAESSGVADSLEKDFRELFAGSEVQGKLFGVRWAFSGPHGLDDAHVEESFEDVLLDEAYPSLDEFGGVEKFLDAYLASDETVLILQGSPGTGKTRLVRALLARISERNKEVECDGYRSRDRACALYTGDKRTLENDEIFARFITGDEDVFVVEDADHLLKPRTEGNENLHRFLAVADGVIRAGGRKIVFSTNLPNLGDVDDALVRPGRCFARVASSDLDSARREALVAKLCGDDEALQAAASKALAKGGRKESSVAEVYKAVATAKSGRLG